MPRPKFISNEDIARFNKNIDNDSNLPPIIKGNEVIREVCMAGLYLGEELEKLKCPDEFIIRIIYSAGRLSFGKDPWDIHLKMLEDFKSNNLEYETDYNLLN